MIRANIDDSIGMGVRTNFDMAFDHRSWPGVLSATQPGSIGELCVGPEALLAFLETAQTDVVAEFLKQTDRS